MIRTFAIFFTTFQNQWYWTALSFQSLVDVLCTTIYPNHFPNTLNKFSWWRRKTFLSLILIKLVAWEETWLFINHWGCAGRHRKCCCRANEGRKGSRDADVHPSSLLLLFKIRKWQRHVLFLDLLFSEEKCGGLSVKHSNAHTGEEAAVQVRGPLQGNQQAGRHKHPYGCQGNWNVAVPVEPGAPCVSSHRLKHKDPFHCTKSAL